MKNSILYFALLTWMFSCSSPSKFEEESQPIIPEITATCNDNVKNGTETGIDCGGNSCNPCASATAVIPQNGYIAPENYQGYSLVWSDEFNSSELNSQNWSFHAGNGCPNLCGWGNNELQFFTAKNYELNNGNLVITAKNENSGGSTYTSTRIHSDDKFEFKYGRVDVRAAMPAATGTWVALWLLNKEYSVQNPSEWWPKGGEIDLMEYLGEDPTEIFGTAHYGSNLSSHNFNSKYVKAPSEDFTMVYHVFSILWEENKITWLLNDKPYHTITPEDTKGQPYPFNDEFYLVMSLSVGGNLPVSPIASQFPAFLIVDYIRVFQQ